MSICVNIIEPPRDKTNKMTVCPAKTQISLGIHPVWSVFAVCLITQAFFMRTAKTLIRLGGCPGWSESSLGTHVILLVLSWGGSDQVVKHSLPSPLAELIMSQFYNLDFNPVIANSSHSSATLCLVEIWSWNEPHHEKTCLCHMWTTRRRSACASTQSDQRLCCSLPR